MNQKKNFEGIWNCSYSHKSATNTKPIFNAHPGNILIIGSYKPPHDHTFTLLVDRGAIKDTLSNAKLAINAADDGAVLEASFDDGTTAYTVTSNLKPSGDNFTSDDIRRTYSKPLPVPPPPDDVGSFTGTRPGDGTGDPGESGE